MSAASGEFKKIEEMFSQINTKLQCMDGKIEHFLTEIKGLKQENEKLKAQASEQDKRIESLEREIRKRNLIIKGVEDDKNEGEKETWDKTKSLLQSMGVQIRMEADIDEIRRLGKHREGAKRPILLKLSRGTKKMEILKQTNTLKGTNIWIDEDYTKEIQNERKRLLPQLKEARQKGFKAQLKYNKLLINGVVHKPDERSRSPEGKQSESEKKRTASVRSPEEDNFTLQSRKITRTMKQK